MNLGTVANIVSRVANSTKNVFASGSWKDNHANPAYSSGKITKLNKDFNPFNISGDAGIAESWHVSNARARDLVRNDPIISKALKMTSALVIGSGINAFSEASDASHKFMDDFSEQSDDDFEYWALNEADATGRETLPEMQETSFKEMVTTGLSIWLEVINNDSSRTSPLSYQLLESEQIDRTKDRPADQGRTRIVNGIELDKHGKAVAVHLYDEHPYEYGSHGTGVPLTSKRIPIRRLILNFRPDRVSSHIGITWVNNVVQVARDTDRLVANELTSRAVKALMTLFVKRDNPGTCVADALNAEDPETRQSPVSMGYPAIVELAKDEEIGIAESTGKSGEDAKTFVDLLLGQFAMGTGLSKHRLTGNAGEANMASIRAGHNDDERVTDPLLKHQTNKVVRPIRLRHQSLAAALGKFSGVGVTPAFYASNRRRMSKLFIISAGDPDFQPKDDGEASIDRIRSGRTTPQYEIGRLGFYWRRNLRQTKQYMDELEKLGLGSPDWTKGAGGTYLPFVPLKDQPVMQNAKQNVAKEGATSE